LHVKIIRMRNLRKADLLSQSDCYVELWLPTASTQRVRTKTIKNCKNPIWNETFRYRIDSRVKNMLELKVCDEDRFSKDDELCTVLFDIAKLQVGYKVRVKFVLNPQEQEELEVEFILQNILDCPENIITNGVLVDKTFDLHVKAKDWPKDMDVRFGFDLCTEEQVFLCKRKKYVAATVKKVLQLEEDLQDHEVPVVAITTTGGGTRSLTAMYGSLLGLQKLNILDSISYITGLSGTTWTMANLYEDANWSQKYLEEAINKARKHVTKCKIKGFTLDRLKYYYNELKERCQQGYNTSFIDLWGLMVEYMLHDEKDNHKLSDQQQAMSEGQNPLPIYMAINLKNSYSSQDFREWLEFTPYEVGFWKYGAFIRSQDFGSEFFMGRLMKKFPESRICFMEGMWSGIFSFDVMYFWNLAFDSEDFWYRWTRDRVNDIVPPTCWQVLLICSSPYSPVPPERGSAVQQWAEGVERSPTEMEEGKVDVSSPLSPYTTKELSFSEENFDNLVKMTDYNILNNENLIVQALRTAVERRKQQAPKYYKGALIQ
ncbi:Cytosolic phospholipase A2 epsilon, partial [Chelonia mydas]